MPQEMKGRRVAKFEDIREAGDYYGPDDGNRTGGKIAVFYLLPIARDHDAHDDARSIHHCVSPPHEFVECSDGSLTVYDSIGNPHWHGFLHRGNWCLKRPPT